MLPIAPVTGDSKNDPRVLIQFKSRTAPLTGVILPKSAVDLIDTVRGQQIKRMAEEADKENADKKTKAAIDIEDKRKEEILEKRRGMFLTPGYNKQPNRGLLDRGILGTDTNLD